ADEPVALVMERSPQLVTGILGILLAGGAYVPVDAQYPRERVAWMLSDCRARVAVAQEHLVGILPPDLRALRIEHEWDALAAGPGGDEAWPDAGPEGAAYVIYTSGSTGRPKGVVVPHRAVLRLVRGADYARFGADETWLQLAPVSFDASTLELWAPLLNGGCLAIYPPERPTPEALGEFISRHGVTSAWLTAGLFHQVVDAGLPALGGLTQLLAGGDVLSVLHVRQVLEMHPRPRLINGYGPTENTTFSCCHAIEPDDCGRASIPIGRPVAGGTAYVLDAVLRPLPVDVPGELFVGGEGVARGYLRAPGLTAERYLPDPFSATPGARLYRTGDRARWRGDGTLEFLGRSDFQVKVRGFRIEPGEIEAIVRRHPAVAAAVVQVREDTPGERRLVAYVVPASGAARDGARLEDEVRGALREQLPDYVVPSAIVALNELPLTPGGKLDRSALPAPVPRRTLREPRTEVERTLAAIWQEVLGIDRVYLDDDFNELGGDSISAIQMVVRVRQKMGIALPLIRLFDETRLAALAEVVEAAQREAREALFDALDETWKADDPVLALAAGEPARWWADE
ncbi:MAG TPA: non-ribosomal peptide synthetase, partial [Longimicrobium sp.]|nr:non-ribosomal peptide synthetase [Longimicrobium sp.]